MLLMNNSWLGMVVYGPLQDKYFRFQSVLLSGGHIMIVTSYSLYLPW